MLNFIIPAFLALLGGATAYLITKEILKNKIKKKIEEKNLPPPLIEGLGSIVREIDKNGKAIKLDVFNAQGSTVTNVIVPTDNCDVADDIHKGTIIDLTD